MLQQYLYIASVVLAFTCAFLFCLYLIVFSRGDEDGSRYFEELARAIANVLSCFIVGTLAATFLSGLGMITGK